MTTDIEKARERLAQYAAGALAGLLASPNRSHRENEYLSTQAWGWAIKMLEAEPTEERIKTLLEPPNTPDAVQARRRPLGGAN